MTDAHRHDDRLRGRPALVAARPLHGGVGHGAAVPARRHDLPRRRARRRGDLDRAARRACRRCASRRRSGRSGSAGCSATTPSTSRPCASRRRPRPGLINYLWPLLIVLFSALLPGERLRAAHVVGRAPRLCRRGRAHRRPRRPRRAGRVLAGLSVRLRLRVRVVGLFGAVAPLRRGADGRGRRLLPRDRRLEPRLPPRLRDDGLAGRRRRNGSPSWRSASGRSGARSTSGTSA